MTHETIRLVIGEKYTDAITELLEERYDVVSRPPPGGDLCLIEQRQLPNLRHTLESIVDEEHPVFYPIVLFRQRNATGSVDVLETDGRPLIDDVVTMPIDEVLFERRLENLLVRRRYSTSLSRYHRRRHERFNGLFDAIAEPAVVLDDTGNVVQMNDRFCGVYGENRASLFGSSIDALLDSGEREIVETDSTPPTDRRDRTVTIEDDDGNKRHLKLATRQVSHQGEAYTVLVLTDVTSLCRRLKRLRRRLETIERPARSELE